MMMGVYFTVERRGTGFRPWVVIRHWDGRSVFLKRTIAWAWTEAGAFRKLEQIVAARVL